MSKAIDQAAVADLALLSQRAWIQSRVDEHAVEQAATGTTDNPNGCRFLIATGGTPKRTTLGRRRHARTRKRFPKCSTPSPTSRSRLSRSVQQGAQKQRPLSAIASSKSYPRTLESLQRIITGQIQQPSVSVAELLRKGEAPFEISSLHKSLKSIISSSPMTSPPETRQSHNLNESMTRSINLSLSSVMANSTLQVSKYVEAARSVAIRKKLRIEARDKHMWSKVVAKELRTALKPMLLRHIQLQQQWAKFISHAMFLKRLKRTLDQIYTERAENQKRNFSIARLQSGWRSRYALRMNEKHQRTFEILREKVWVARLNVRTRTRSREARLVRSFVQSFSRQNRFSVMIRAFRWRVIRCQRAARSFFAIKFARLRLLTMRWLEVEPLVLQDLELEAREKEALVEKRRKVRRMSASMGLSESEVKKLMGISASPPTDTPANSGSHKNRSGSSNAGTNAKTCNHGEGKQQDLEQQNQKETKQEARQNSRSYRNLRQEMQDKKRTVINAKVKDLIDVLNEREKLINLDKARQNSKTKKRNQGAWRNSTDLNQLLRDEAEQKMSNKNKNKKTEKFDLFTSNHLPGIRPMPKSLAMAGGPAYIGPFTTVKRRQRIPRVSRSKAKSSAQARSSLSSRFDPLAPAERKEILLNWLSEERRKSFLKYESTLNSRISESCQLSVLDVRQLFENEEVDDAASLKSKNLLAAKLKHRDLPPYVFACFSELATKRNLHHLVKKSISDRERKRNANRQAAKEAKKAQEEATRNLTSLARIKKSKNPGQAALIPDVLRNILGRKLLDELGNFSVLKNGAI